MITEKGPGDTETWSPCTGHPHDPRTIEPELPELSTTEICEDCGLERFVSLEFPTAPTDCPECLGTMVEQDLDNEEI